EDLVHRRLAERAVDVAHEAALVEQVHLGEPGERGAHRLGVAQVAQVGDDGDAALEVEDVGREQVRERARLEVGEAERRRRGGRRRPAGARGGGRGGGIPPARRGEARGGGRGGGGRGRLRWAGGSPAPAEAGGGRAS